MAQQVNQSGTGARRRGRGVGAGVGVLALLATPWLAAQPSPAGPPVNLLPNPSFELVEPPLPTPATQGQPAPPERWVPRTWSFWPPAWDSPAFRLPDDPAQAHSGRRCVRVQAGGGALAVRYGPIPHVDARPWTVRFWARGSGRLAAVAHEFLHPWTWTRLQDWSFPLTAAWAQFEFEFIPPPACATWVLDLDNQASGELWLDDVFVGHPGLTPLGLPPGVPAAVDRQTLFCLPFEEPLDPYAYFVKGCVTLTADGAGRFGKALVLGPEGYVACSAAGKVRRTQGTIEMWVKLLSPGNDGLTQTILQIAGPDGWNLRKDTFGHLMFSFTADFQLASTAWAETYASSWQPGVWRHLAVCWDQELLQLFVDGKLAAWEIRPRLPPTLGDELAIGPASMEIDDLRISDQVRYRVPVWPNGPRRNESFIGGKGRY